MPVIRELPRREWIDAFPLMKELRPHLDLDTYLSLLDEMRRGYRLFALEEDGLRGTGGCGGGDQFLQRPPSLHLRFGDKG